MRASPRIIRQFRSNSRHIFENHSIGWVGRRHWVTRELSDTLQAIHNARMDPFYPTSLMISRAVSTDVEQLSNGEENGERGGPLVEYQRRIAAGELMDGDLCQVCGGEGLK